LRKFKDLPCLRFIAGVVGRCSEVVCSRAKTWKVNADKCEAIRDVFVVKVAIADPAFDSWELDYWFRTLDTACDLDDLIE